MDEMTNGQNGDQIKNGNENEQAYVAAPEPRMDLSAALPDFYRAMLRLEQESKRHLDPVVVHLVKTRISQLNGCAFCIDMHTSEARKDGEQEHRLYGLSAWRETPFYTARERAALALGEAIARLGEHGVPDEVYGEAAKLFSEQELASLIAVAVTINGWNRISVTTHMSPAAR